MTDSSSCSTRKRKVIDLDQKDLIRHRAEHTFYNSQQQGSHHWRCCTRRKSRHFATEDYQRQYQERKFAIKVRLKCNAVPTLFLPSEEQRDLQRKKLLTTAATNSEMPVPRLQSVGLPQPRLRPSDVRLHDIKRSSASNSAPTTPLGSKMQPPQPVLLCFSHNSSSSEPQKPPSAPTAVLATSQHAETQFSQSRLSCSSTDSQLPNTPTLFLTTPCHAEAPHCGAPDDCVILTTVPVMQVSPAECPSLVTSQENAHVSGGDRLEPHPSSVAAQMEQKRLRKMRPVDPEPARWPVPVWKPRPKPTSKQPVDTQPAPFAVRTKKWWPTPPVRARILRFKHPFDDRKPASSSTSEDCKVERQCKSDRVYRVRTVGTMAKPRPRHVIHVLASTQTPMIVCTATTTQTSPKTLRSRGTNTGRKW